MPILSDRAATSLDWVPNMKAGPIRSRFHISRSARPLTESSRLQFLLRVRLLDHGSVGLRTSEVEEHLRSALNSAHHLRALCRLAAFSLFSASSGRRFLFRRRLSCSGTRGRCRTSASSPPGTGFRTPDTPCGTSFSVRSEVALRIVHAAIEHVARACVLRPAMSPPHFGHFTSSSSCLMYLHFGYPLQLRTRRTALAAAAAACRTSGTPLPAAPAASAAPSGSACGSSCTADPRCIRARHKRPQRPIPQHHHSPAVVAELLFRQLRRRRER